MKTFPLLSTILVTLATQACALEPELSQPSDVAIPRMIKRDDVQVNPPPPPPPPPPQQQQQTEAKSDDKSSTFNGVKLPAMTELRAESFDEITKNGHWLVKLYSPYCPYCREIAPNWQTIYEFYSASQPAEGSTPQNSPIQFEDFYDLHFASMDCVTNADKCDQLGITMWPTVALFNSSKLVDTLSGEKTIPGLSNFVEKHLNSIHPGSRPNEIHLPGQGAHEGQTPNFKLISTANDQIPAGDDPKNGLRPLPLVGNEENAGHKGEEKPVGPTTSQPAPEATTPTPAINIYSSQGASVPLTAESFQKLVTNSEDTWFIRFYSDRSVYSRNLRPIWHHFAKAMRGKINIGEVNCDTELALCKDARIRRYPTMIFFRGGNRVRYDGARGYGDLIKVASRAVDIAASPIKDVSEASFGELEQKEDVIFLYFYDHATTSEDFDAIDRTRLELVAHAPIFKTNDTGLAKRFGIITYPRLMCYREGQANYYAQTTPEAMRDNSGLLRWMKSVWLPLVPELNPANAREILHHKYAVLGIINRRRPDHFTTAKRELKNAALEWNEKQSKLFQMERQELRDSKQLRIAEAQDRNDKSDLRSAKSMRIQISEDDRKQTRFAWVDSVFWQRWLKTSFGIDARRVERVIISDDENGRYWDATTSGAPITPSRTSILETLTNIVSSPYNLNSNPISGSFDRFPTLRVFVLFHPVFASVLVVVFCASIMFSLRLRIRRWRSSLFGSKPQPTPSSNNFDAPEGGVALPMTVTTNGAGKVD